MICFGSSVAFNILTKLKEANLKYVHIVAYIKRFIFLLKDQREIHIS